MGISWNLVIASIVILIFVNKVLINCTNRINRKKDWKWWQIHSWYTYVIRTLGIQRMKNIHQGQPGLHCEFLASLSYIQGLDSDIQKATNSTNQANKENKSRKRGDRAWLHKQFQSLLSLNSLNSVLEVSLKDSAFVQCVQALRYYP